MRPITIKMDDELLERIDSYAIKNKIDNRSEAIRRLILIALEVEESKTTIKQGKVEKI